MPHSNILRNILVIALINLSLVVAIFDFDKFFAGTAPSPQLIHTKAVYTNTKADQGSNQILGLTDNFPKYEFCNLIFENRLVSPDSILEVVDKENMLPADYMPSDLHTLDASKYNVTRTIQLRESAYNSLIPMLNDMNAANLEYAITSGYRSYTTQQYAFNYWARYVGLAEAGGFAASPGYSEHQLGTTVDIMSAENNFKATSYMGQTQVGIWLKDNAYKYGFVQSYPEGKTEITGYNYEPWHYRYVGKYVAGQIHENGLSLTEYLYDFYNICL